jgi:hypothetical protein
MITNINWEACQKSLNQLPFGKRRWLIKHATGFCEVGRMEQIRGNQDHDHCPRCGQPEDAPHVVRCRGTETDIIFEVGVQKLEVTMWDNFTAPEIKRALVTRIRQWRQRSTSQTKDQETAFPPYIRRDKFGTYYAMAAQDRIGWYNLRLGRLAKQWTEARQKYLESIDKKTTGNKRWTIPIISKLWDITWGMWEHRNHIMHNTLHPKKQQELEQLGQRVEAVYNHQGMDTLLSRDRPLFQKPIATVRKGTVKEQEQWLMSVMLAQQRAAAIAAERQAWKHVERTLMETWLGVTRNADQAGNGQNS